MDQLDHMVAEGFVRREHRDGIHFDDQPARLLRQLAAFQAPDIHKWIDRDRAQWDQRRGRQKQLLQSVPHCTVLQ